MGFTLQDGATLSDIPVDAHSAAPRPQFSYTWLREREQGQIIKAVFFLLQGIRKVLSVRPRPRSWRPMWREGGRVQTAKPPAGLRGAGPLAPVATGKSGTFGQHTVVISIFTW
jgi:hypothetical protein